MQPLLNIAMRAARRAGDLIVKSLSRLDSLKIDTKGRNDFVTDIDRKAEADIIATIRRSYPQHAVLAEESGRSGENEFVWIIDPLDGTTNFLHGFPTFAGLDSASAKGPPAARRGLRPDAPGVLYRLARRRRAAGRQENPRQRPAHPGRRADRHRVPVSRRRDLCR